MSLTTRQLYKAHALAGLLACPDTAGSASEIVAHCATYADAMIAEDEAHAAKSAPHVTTHNPDNLTPEQVGTAEGWRLLDWDEIILRSDSLVGIEKWECGEWDNTGWRGGQKSSTYRTKLSKTELAKLP